MKRFDELLAFIGANKKIELIKFITINAGIIMSTVLVCVFSKQWLYAFIGLMAIAILNYLLIC